MKKLLLLLLALLLSAPAVIAAPTADLVALARYAPSDSLAFAAIRTDDAYLQTLDSLFTTVAAKLPSGIVPPGIALQPLLNLAAQQITGQDFATGIRTWLGDTAALAVLSPNPDSRNFQLGLLAAISITDRAAAEAFVTKLSALANLTPAPGDGYTLFEGAGGVLNVLVGKDVILIGSSTVDLRAVYANVSDSLLANPEFNQTLSLLPASQYNIIIYNDTSAILNTIPGFMSDLEFYRIINAQVLGFTVLDDRAYVVDAAFNVGDTSPLATLGLTPPVINPVDLSFAAFIPSDASLVFHSANARAWYDFTLERSRMSDFRPGATDENVAIMRQMLAEQFGLDLDNDILPLLEGDYAAFVRIDTQVIFGGFLSTIATGTSPEITTVPFGFGLIAQNTDTAKAEKVFAAFNAVVATQVGVEISQKQINGTTLTVLTSTMPIVPDAEALPFEIAFGANDTVFFFGSLSDIEKFLAGDSLSASPTYQAASAYLLPNPTSVWYSDPNGGLGGGLAFVGLTLLGPAIDAIFNNINDRFVTPTPQELDRRAETRRIQAEQNRLIVETYNGLIALMESASISTASTADGHALLRAVLTLAP